MRTGKNKKLMTALVGVALLIVVSWLVIGHARQASEPEVQVLRLALIPADDIDTMINRFEPVRQYLETELGIPIEIFRATSYTAVVEAMRAEKIEVAMFGPLAYVLAAERANARPIVTTGSADGQPGVYFSVLLTNRDTGIQNIDDVKARASELTLAFVDPASTSGYLVPKGFFKSIGIDVDKAFEEVVFAGGHDAALLAVHARTADLSTTTAARHQRAVEAGIIDGNDVRIIWKSDPIPNSPFAVRGDLDEALIRRIQQAFLDMHVKAPAVFAEWVRGEEAYVAVTTENYDFVRQVAIGLGIIEAPRR